MKVLHKISRYIHGFIHDMAATHNADFVEPFDVIWEKVCRDIFSMFDYADISEYACLIKFLMMPIHHQMMTIKGTLYMIFIWSTLKY